MPPTLVYEHDKANRMSKIKGEGSYSGTFNPAYDKAGNQTFAYAKDRGTSYKYSYDHNNRLLAVHDDTGTTRKAALTYDALGRRIEYINDVTGDTVRYYYDGVNEIVETNASGSELRHYVHGISYVDERLMLMRHDLADADDDRPYYYVVDRQYNVWMVVDRAGAIVERYAYDPYGRPLIRESAGRGDMNNDTDVNGTDNTRFLNELGNTIWDPRADMNDDGSVNTLDLPAFNHARDNVWTEGTPAVSQAFSDVDNPFMFQGRPHFAIDTGASETSGRLMLNDHRARFSDVATGRWNTRDPAGYVDGWNLYEFVRSNPIEGLDPTGRVIIGISGLGESPQDMKPLTDEIRRRVNARLAATGHTYRETEQNTKLFGGGLEPPEINALKEIEAWVQRKKSSIRPGGCEEPISISEEEIVLVGHSDGATALFRIANMRKTRFPANNPPGNIWVGYLGFIDMVRTEYWHGSNPSKNRWVAHRAHLPTHDDNFYQENTFLFMGFHIINASNNILVSNVDHFDIHKSKKVINEIAQNAAHQYHYMIHLHNGDIPDGPFRRGEPE